MPSLFVARRVATRGSIRCITISVLIGACLDCQGASNSIGTGAPAGESSSSGSGGFGAMRGLDGSGVEAASSGGGGSSGASGADAATSGADSGGTGSSSGAEAHDSSSSGALESGVDSAVGGPDASVGEVDGSKTDSGALLFNGPPIGFNPYNNLWCNPTETKMRAFADAIVSHGMLAAGYVYLNVDCAWQGTRNSNGDIQANANFPSGIKSLADYAHNKGLKFGIYTAPGTMTCDNKPGSQGYETQDVKTYASWGVDYIKLDWCGADYSASGAAAIAQKWKDAIAAAGRPMVLSINAGASASVAPWASSRVNLWRVGDDICDTWFNKTGARNAGTSHCTSTTAQNGIYDYLTLSLDYLIPSSGSGHWGDPDMLHVGNPGLTLDESITHFSIWAMWSAPLIAGNDTTKMNGSDIASKVLLNSEVIAIDQDPKNNWATRVKNTAALQIYKKNLAASNSYAVALVNMTNSAATMTLNWSDVGLTTVTSIRDLWAHMDITPAGSSYTAAAVPAHGTVMLRLTGN